MELQPEYSTVNRLLQDRLFRIPNYQRAYSWEKKQRDDLFEDIVKLSNYKDDRHHFMATIVCLKRESKDLDSEIYTIYDLVDGGHVPWSV